MRFSIKNKWEGKKANHPTIKLVKVVIFNLQDSSIFKFKIHFLIFNTEIKVFFASTYVWVKDWDYIRT